MGSPVRVKGAEQTVSGNTVFKEFHAAQGIFFLDELHVIDFIGGIIHENENVKELSWEIWDPRMGTSVKVKHHADERFPGASFSVPAPGRSFVDKAGGLESLLDKGVSPVDVVVIA